MDANPLYLMIMVFVLLRYPNFIITKMKIEIKTENGKLKKIFARCSFIYYNKNVRIQEFSNDIRFREIIAQTALESWEKREV